jgi:hypothetical protein
MVWSRKNGNDRYLKIACQAGEQIQRKISTDLGRGDTEDLEGKRN